MSHVSRSGVVYAVVGFGLAGCGGWLLLAPLFGGADAALGARAAALGGFLLGIFLLRRGIKRLLEGPTSKRPDIDATHSHTDEPAFNR